LQRDQVPDWSVMGCRFRAFLGAGLERDGVPDCSVLLSWRGRLCGFLGLPPGPALSDGTVTLVV
jgi:hypothetical protein